MNQNADAVTGGASGRYRLNDKMQADNKALLDGVCRFIGIRAEHLAQLPQHAPALLARRELLGKELYWYLLKTPDAAQAWLSGFPDADALVASLLRYLRLMLTTPTDGAAARRAVEQGRSHARLGVDMAWLAGAYERCLTHWLARLAEQDMEPARRDALGHSLRKRVLLDQMLQWHGCQQALQTQVSQSGRQSEAMADLYATLSSVSLALAECTDRRTLLQSICDVCVRDGKFGMAWIGTLDSAAERLSVSAVASEGRCAQLEKVQLSACNESLKGHLPIARAVRNRVLQVVGDVETDAGLQDCRAELRRHGIRSMLVAPLMLRNQVFGTLSLYATQAGGFDPAKVSLVNVMAREIGRALERHDALERSRKAEAELAFLSHHDVLTGLPNRLQIKDHIARLLHARSAGREVAVLAVSLHGFHDINARFGHDGGDAVLCEAARRLRRCIYPFGQVGRVGASRFIACTERTDLLDKLLGELSHRLQAPLEIMGAQLEIHCNIGVAVSGQAAVDAATMLRRADLALGQAKDAGRGQCRHYDAAMDEEIQRLHAIRSAFAQAIPRGELALYYQPKINLLNNRIEGAEALVRWVRNGRTVPPGEFFPAVENTELMRELDWWVVREAVRQACEWREQGKSIPVSVNLSAITLKHESFLPNMESLLEANPLPIGYLELEVLESVTQQEAEQITAKLERCRDLGLSIALDDFGTGASSLVHLQQLPFDTIKMDQRFVRLLLETPGNEAIIRSMVAFAHYTGRKLVVEGVESRAIWNRLLEIGCLDGQGYEISPPVAAAELPAWITRWHGRREVLDYEIN